MFAHRLVLVAAFASLAASSLSPASAELKEVNLHMSEDGLKTQCANSHGTFSSSSHGASCDWGGATFISCDKKGNCTGLMGSTALANPPTNPTAPTRPLVAGATRLPLANVR